MMTFVERYGSRRAATFYASAQKQAPAGSEAALFILHPIFCRLLNRIIRRTIRNAAGARQGSMMNKDDGSLGNTESQPPSTGGDHEAMLYP
jgi:hypothetical protein